VPKRFNKPTYCEYCNKLIWGIVGKQGAKCKTCKFCIHFECQEFAIDNCKIRESLTYNKHKNTEKFFTRLTFCNTCRDFLPGITGKQGTDCDVCRSVKHRECVDLHNCPPYYFEKKCEEKDITHYWIEGNIKGNCVVCGNTNVCGSHLGGIKCHWCGVKLCSYVCLKKL